MKVITTGTLKGGTGKTSVTFNIAGILAENSKVLLIDTDPQCNLSINVGVNVVAKGLNTIKNIFESNSIKAEQVILKKPIQELFNIDIIPSNIYLTATERNIINRAGREQILSNFIKDNREYLQTYDYIMIDTNPSMNIVNQNAFLVADSIILVSDVSLNGVQGAELFIALWEDTIEQLRIENNIKALIINNFDKKTTLSTELLEYCESNEDIEKILLKTVIPSSIKLKRTDLSHKPINILNKNSNIHQAYQEIISELKKKEIL